MYHLPRKFPLFFTDELSIFTSFSSSAIVPRTISVIFHHHRSTPRNGRTPERARTLLLSLSLTLKVPIQKRNETKNELEYFGPVVFVFRDRSANDLSYCFIIIARRRETEEHPSARAPSFLYLTLKVPIQKRNETKNELRRIQTFFVFHDRSDDAFGTISGIGKTFSSSSSLDAEKRAHLPLLYRAHFCSDTKTKRNEKRAQLAKRIFFFSSSAIVPTTPSERSQNCRCIHHHRSNIAETSKNQKTTTTTTGGVVSFTSQRTLLQTSRIVFYTWETPLAYGFMGAFIFRAYFLTTRDTKKKEKKKKKKKRRRRQAGRRRQKKKKKERAHKKNEKGTHKKHTTHHHHRRKEEKKKN